MNYAAAIYLAEFSDDVWETNRPDAAMPDVHEIEERSVIFRSAINEALSQLRELPQETEREEYQFVFYEVGKQHYGKENLRRWFADIYLLLTRRSSSGPRIGDIVYAIGVDAFEEKINQDL